MPLMDCNLEEFAIRVKPCEMIKATHIKLNIRQVLEILIQIAVALEFIHPLEVTHLDLKPSNILLKVLGDGRVIAYLADFDLATAKTASHNVRPVLLSSFVK